MLPSSTVENYLKAIYMGVGALPDPQRLLPMGHLAAALGVAPGTATTMVKALAEAGLVEYAPYSGVALTSAGEKLAALVVRHHRVVELFLVQFMGYGWDEVHDEAEQLEHVVSDRLIDRMDEMLGRPEVDPHGDPIPNADGVVKPQEAQSLLTCPLHTKVTVTRVIDQDKLFLRFIENHNLKPGEAIEVEARDQASDSVRVKGKNDERITIGTRAASKLLVQLAPLLLLLLVLVPHASAQTAPFAILDNSFLVEEAFNQESGVFQNIFNVRATEDGSWEATFTQEWPLPGQTHQLSYTVPFASLSGASGFGDVMLNYRWQALAEGAGRPAFSPRISLIVPTGDSSRGLGAGNLGWQINLPFSKQFRDAYLHWNGGFTHAAAVDGTTDSRELTPFAAASVIWQARPMLNPMVEMLVEWEEGVTGAVSQRAAVITLSPGLRTGWNIGDAQTIVGLAVPVVFADGAASGGVFAYLSHELPFRMLR